MSRSLGLIVSLALLACTERTDKRMEEQLRPDPVFALALENPEWRQRLLTSEVQQSISNPAFKRQLRIAISDEVIGYPDEGDVADLDKQLKGRCGKAATKWTRMYGFAADEERGGSDPTKIGFLWRESDRNLLKVVRTSELYTLDDAEGLRLMGAYDAQAGSVQIEYCGPNVAS